MTTTSAACSVCTSPVNSGLACQACVDRLFDDLRLILGWTTHDGRRIPGLLVDLLVTGTNQDVMPKMGADIPMQTQREPLAVSATPSPGRLDALALHARLQRETRYVLDGIREFGRGRLAQHPGIEHMIRTLSEENGLVIQAERLVDRPDGAFRIPCPTCARRVPIDPTQDIIRCRCGEWGTLDWWKAHVAPEIPDAETINARDGVLWLLVRHGINLGPSGESRIRQWAVRYPSRLRRQGKDQQGRTLYSPGQLLDLAKGLVNAGIQTAC